SQGGRRRLTLLCVVQPWRVSSAIANPASALDDLEGRSDRVADFACRPALTGLTRTDVGDHGPLDPCRLFRKTTVIQQQRDRENRRGRISDALAGDVGSRTVHWLEHRRKATVWIDIGAGGPGGSARERGGRGGEGGA